MDKFEQAIKNAEERIVPSTNFVESTMQQISGKQKQRWGFKLWGPFIAGSLAVLALLFITLPGHNRTTGTQTNQGTGQSQTQTPVAVTPGTDNASLASDLNTIDGQINQGNSNLTSASNAVNDQQQAITVPSN